VRLLVVVMDAPARAITQNCMHYNSRYGCSLCETKALLTARVPGKKRVRRFLYVVNPKLRTHERMLQQALSVGRQEHVRGVKGPSILSSIPSVDISKCMVPEFMHSVLIGVCKQVVQIWTTKAGPWSIKEKIPEIDFFLSSFKHPSFIHRKLRQLATVKYWKASDYLYFLLYEALPSLQRHLPDRYLQHFTMLSIGIFKLLKTTVSETDLIEADLLLKLFVCDFRNLYGERELTYNLHQLIHLGFCTRMYGPLHCWSAFMSEDLNGAIAKTTHGTHQIEFELANNIKICQGVHMLKNIVLGQHGCNSLGSSFSPGEVLGKELTLVIPEEELQLLPNRSLKIFARAKLGYDCFTSEMYKHLRSEDFHVMWSDNGCLKYGSIKYFARTSDCNYVVISVFTVDYTRVFYHQDTLKCVEQFVPIETSQSVVAVKFSDIAKSIVKVGKIESFLYKRPNLYHYVL
jgi:hypothetical protein